MKYAMWPRRSAYDQFCEPTSNDCRPFSKSDRFFARIQVRNASSSWVAENPAYWIDSAVPADWSSCTIGPWLRRGTISVAAGTPLPGGTTDDLAAVVGPERLRDRLHRLQLSLVDGGEPAGRRPGRAGSAPGRCR